MSTIAVIESLYTALVFASIAFFAFQVRGWFRNRAARRAFAARHGLRYVGMRQSPRRSPYAYYSEVLLEHLVEGRWEEFEIGLFDSGREDDSFSAVVLTLPMDITPLRIMPSNGGVSLAGCVPGSLTWRRIMTAPRVTIPWTLQVEAEVPDAAAAALGPRAITLLASHQPMLAETNFSYLRVMPCRRLAITDLEDFLGFASQLARAMVADARDGAR